MKILIAVVLLLLSGCNAMTTNHWQAPSKEEPHAKIVAQKDMDLMWVNDLRVNGLAYWSFEQFILPAGKSEVVLRARRGNDHYGMASFNVDLTAGETYYFINEVVGSNYKISLLDSHKKILLVALAPQQEFSKPFVLPTHAIPNSN